MSNRSRLLLAVPVALALACGGNPRPAPSPVAAGNPVTPADTHAPSVASEPLSDARVMELGRSYTDLLHARDSERLWPRLTQGAQARLGSAAEFERWLDESLEGLGNEVAVIREAVEMPREGMRADRLYVRVSRYALLGERPARILIGLKHDGSIVGMQIRRAD
jgi:hypothetical protein